MPSTLFVKIFQKKQKGEDIVAKITEIPHSEIIGRTLMLLTQTSRLISKYIDAYFYKKARPFIYSVHITQNQVNSMNAPMATAIMNLSLTFRKIMMKDMMKS